MVISFVRDFHFEFIFEMPVANSLEVLKSQRFWSLSEELGALKSSRFFIRRRIIISRRFLEARSLPPGRFSRFISLGLSMREFI